MNIKEQVKKLKVMLPTIFLVLKNKKTPLMAKLFAGITIAYALSPIDLIHDFIPVIGYLDDLIIVPLLIAITIKLIPKALLEECKSQAQGIGEDGRPKRWYYGVPIIVIWIVLIGVILKAVLG